MSWGAALGQAATWVGNNSDKIMKGVEAAGTVASAIKTQKTTTSVGTAPESDGTATKITKEQEAQIIKDNTKGTVGKSTLSWAATGASIGSSFGPWGTLIGGAAGAIGGLIGGIFGKKKKTKKIKAEIAKLNEQAKKTGEPANPEQVEIPKDKGLLEKTDLGSTALKSLAGALLAYMIKDVAMGDKKLNFSAPAFKKETINKPAFSANNLYGSSLYNIPITPLDRKSVAHKRLTYQQSPVNPFLNTVHL